MIPEDYRRMFAYVFDTFRASFALPLLKSDKESAIARVKEKVELYSPLVEEETGVDIGEIPVKMFSAAYLDAMRCSAKRLWAEDSPSTISDKSKFGMTVMCAGALGFVYFKKRAGNVNYSMGDEGDLYIGEHKGRRDGLVWREPISGVEIVHELSHKVWLEESNEVSAGDGKKIMSLDERARKRNKLRQLSEGFACYLSEVELNHIYSSDDNFGESQAGSVYRRYRDDFEALLAREGAEYLDVPRNLGHFLDLD